MPSSVGKLFLIIVRHFHLIIRDFRAVFVFVFFFLFHWLLFGTRHFFSFLQFLVCCFYLFRIDISIHLLFGFHSVCFIFMCNHCIFFSSKGTNHKKKKNMEWKVILLEKMHKSKCWLWNIDIKEEKKSFLSLHFFFASFYSHFHVSVKRI